MCYNPGMHKILVVEDDLDIQGFCKTVLESAGFSVDACVTAAEAEKLFRGGSPDLVIIDIGLPDGSGLDVCRQLGLGGKSRVPFVFLTAQNDLNTRLEAFKIGAQDYIQKPFAVEELLARVKVHMKVKKSQDDLARRNYDLELINRVRQDLTDMIVHDLKTPLTSIKGSLDLIKMRGLISAQDYGGLLDHAGTAADFMLLMLNDLLDIGHSEKTGLPATIAEFPLAPMLEKLKVLFHSRSEHMKVPLAFAAAPGLSVVRSDQNLLFRIAVNLIANAMKASPRDGSAAVELDFRREAAGLRLSVSDRGPGVPESRKKLIFEKYRDERYQELPRGRRQRDRPELLPAGGRRAQRPHLGRGPAGRRQPVRSSSFPTRGSCHPSGNLIRFPSTSQESYVRDYRDGRKTTLGRSRRDRQGREAGSGDRRQAGVQGSLGRRRHERRRGAGVQPFREGHGHCCEAGPRTQDHRLQEAHQEGVQEADRPSSVADRDQDRRHLPQLK